MTALPAASSGAPLPVAVPAARPLPTFTDISAGSGTDDPLGANGLSLRDMDGDGDLDMALGRQHDGYRLLENLGGNRFAEVLAGGGIYTRSAIWGDADQDGDEDLLITSAQVSFFFRNDGAGRWAEISRAAGLRHPALENMEGAGWLDYDADGDLDLVLDDHEDTELLRNDGGTFTVVAPDDNAAKGFQDVQSGDYLAVADYDVDGDIDILVRKGELEPFADLYLNTSGAGPTQFHPVVLPGALSRNRGKGGLAFADVDADGDFDLFYVGAERNMLFRNDSPFVTDITRTAFPGFDPSAAAHDLGGVAWGDFDGDGLPDLYMGSESGANLLWRNLGGGVFAEVSAAAGVAGAAGDMTRGVAFADTDLDGDLDLVVTNQGTANRLYRNEGPPARVPVRFRLTRGPRPHIGAVLQIFAGEPGLGDLDGDGRDEALDGDANGVLDAAEGLVAVSAGENRVDPLGRRGDPIATDEVSGGEGLGGQGPAEPVVYLPAAAHFTARVTAPGGRVVLRDLRVPPAGAGLGSPPDATIAIDWDDPTGDGDGLTAAEEGALGTSAADLDSDDDGLRDDEEDADRSGTVGAGETDPARADSDGDGLADGLERGRAAPIPDPDGPGPIAASSAAGFAGDTDPASTTDPLRADTDGGGVSDGREDQNGNGRVDPGERDPNDPADDRPRLVIEQTAADLDGPPDLPLPGDRLRFTLAVRNEAAIPAAGAGRLRLRELPAGASLVAGSVESDAGAVSSGNAPGDTEVVIEVATLAGGDAFTVRFDALIDAAAAPGDTVRAQAIAAYDSDGDGVVDVTDHLSDDPAPTNPHATLEEGNDPALPDDDDPTLVPIPAAAFVVPSTKLARDPNGGAVAPGDTLLYEIVLRNRGTVALDAVALTDDMPAGVARLAVVALPAGWQDLSVPGGGAHGRGRLEVRGPALARGADAAVTARVVVDFPLADGTVIENQARIGGANLPQPVLTDGDPSAPGQQPTRVVVSAASRLLVRKRVADLNGGVLSPGEALRYVIEVANAGASPATGVAILDDVPAAAGGLAVEHVPAGAADASSAVGGLFGRGMIDVAGITLGPAARDSVVFEVQVDAGVPGGTRIANQAAASAVEEPGPVPSDGDPATPGAQPTVIEVSGRPVLTVRKEAAVEGGERPRPGDFISYFIVVRNEGNAAATRVTLTDAMPRFTLYVPGSMQVDGEARTDAADGDGADFDRSHPVAITVLLGTMAPGAVATVSFQVQVDPELTVSRVIVNRAVVTAIEIEGSIESNDPDGDGPTEVPIEGPAPVNLDFILPQFNPVTSDEVVIRYVAEAAPARLSIFNLVGERLRVFEGLNVQGELLWRLENDAGHPVANGTYVLLLESPAQTRRLKLVVAR